MIEVCVITVLFLAGLRIGIIQARHITVVWGNQLTHHWDEFGGKYNSCLAMYSSNV